MQPLSRRTLLRSSTFGAGAFAVGAPLLAKARYTGRAAGDATLRIGLVGCGGRGSGAAAQALRADPNVRLVAMADAFGDNLEGSLNGLRGDKEVGDRVDVPEERRFSGFDAYQRVIDSDIDVVILATPPGFRPMHFEYAVAKEKHIFMEKPVAVDGAGVRQVLAAAATAKAKGLKVGVGLQRHHDQRYIDTITRIHDGAVGKPVLLRVYWNSGGVWVRPRQPGQTEMEYQMRNWYYFNWLCGDHITEQHIHNLDVGNWVMQGYPAECQGMGGREVRKGIDHGEIYDHHALEYTYADGTKMQSHCRHQGGTWSSVSEHIHGTLGSGNIGAGRLNLYSGEDWRWRGEGSDPYQVEHNVLFAAIRAGVAHEEAENGAKSTLTSIMGRLATYSGKPVKWEEALNSSIELRPSEYSFTGTPPSVPDEHGAYPIAVPGQTQVV
ncbi:MAG: Gfo/Idh/MocA family oxidoreductase [Planctomycetota bacterium]